jgi:DNA-binding PadR family transcriptional regulator
VPSRSRLTATDSPPAPDRLVRQFFLGFVRTHILFHAAEEPVCGVDLAEELARHGYRLSPGTLYPTLHGLEAAGYLRCVSEVRDGRVRKRYRITPAGRWALTEVRKQIAELVEEVMGGDGRARERRAK